MIRLVTGAAGFIGFHLAQRLLDSGDRVVGLDGLTDYYDVGLKRRRLALLETHPNFSFAQTMLEDREAIGALFRAERFDTVHHLAAQAGVRHSIEQPQAYISANIVGTFNLLEACRRAPPRHLVFASTSSAYGANAKFPFEETDPAIHPTTLYAATKASGELMAHCYAHLFGVPTTAVRFFTVYGPWGRPDMSYFRFTEKMLRGEPIDVYNHGESWRDFTYVDDLVDSMLALTALPPAAPGEGRGAPIAGDTLSPVAPYRLVNIGGGRPVRLADFIDEIEKALGVRAMRRLLPLPPGDVVRTFASADLLKRLTGAKPATPVSVGIPRFVAWYRQTFN